MGIWMTIVFINLFFTESIVNALYILSACINVIVEYFLLEFENIYIELLDDLFVNRN